MCGKALKRLTAWIHDNQLAPTLGELLEIGRRHGVVFDRIGTNYDSHIRIFNLVECCSYCTRSNVFNQR